ncbi:ribulose-phosphate 3-epimerase [Anaerocaecibacter muris]|uniref:ribulose-phosphate 3-epimerase n=1 Tax=Anaerocaecibacter muris TaxID=2941513 RepID=UPI00204146D3|nr:ribulose-phosphate 3-epimerase [Anaerocaecibacter muris]
MISSGAGAISASMMCSNLVDLSEAISIFERNKIEYLHIDVMDGDFVPNYGLGVDYIRGLRELTKIPLDIHLMVNNPEYKLGYLDLKNTDIVSIHYESTRQLQRAIDNTKKYGCKCFLAINPSTPISVLEEVLDYIDGINMLMVNPGFAGQKIVPSTIKKIDKLAAFLEENGKPNIKIEVDGNITFDYARLLKAKGASIFVAGTSSIFNGNVKNYEANIKNFRSAIA